MKRVGELGISMMPWTAFDDNVYDVEGNGVVYSRDCSYLSSEDANLIAAAPELYEALHNAIITTCDGCDYENCEEECRECPRHWWRDVLAKAAGEEKSND